MDPSMVDLDEVAARGYLLIHLGDVQILADRLDQRLTEGAVGSVAAVQAAYASEDAAVAEVGAPRIPAPAPAPRVGAVTTAEVLAVIGELEEALAKVKRFVIWWGHEGSDMRWDLRE